MSQKAIFSREYYLRSEEALAIALNTAKVYDSWKKFDPGDGTSIDNRYAAMPILTKKIMRENFPQGLVPYNRCVADGYEQGEIDFVRTSGTNEDVVTNLWSQSWWNASEAASWKLNDNTAHLDHTCREAQLTSAMNVGFLSGDDLPMESRTLGRFLFLNEKASANELGNHHFARMVRELGEFKPALIEANPSFLVRLAWWIIENDVPVYSPQVVLFTYELVSALHLQTIRQVFPVPIASSYGTTETGYVFMQCQYSTFHQNTGFCRVDFEPLQEIHGGPDTGRILVTTFDNPWASLIRFDVGDLVTLKNQYSCPCGRNEGYMLSSIDGRLANATFTTTGHLITSLQLDRSLSASDGFRDYQLEQISHREYLLKLIANSNPQQAAKKAAEALTTLYGRDAEITIELCDFLEPMSSGKFRRSWASFDFNMKEVFA